MWGTMCIAEEDYERQMRQEVEPYLKNVGQCRISDGFYRELYLQDDPKGTIVISFGFTETSEKFHEMIYYMYKKGYQVAIQDHRGHGRSFREVADRELVHVERFSDYVDDLHKFIEEDVIPVLKGRPLYLYAHSMGGCIGVLYMEAHPDIFDKAVLSAPMLGINNGKFPDWSVIAICLGAIMIGKKKEKLFTMGSFDGEEPFEKSGGNSRARHEYFLKRRREEPDYQTSAATYSWVYQAVRATKRAIAPKNAAKIDIPVLLFEASDDTYVRAREQDIFLSRIPNGRKITVDSRHEIFRHGNETLKKYIEQIFTFFDGNI